jgi:hypothetical protein
VGGIRNAKPEKASDGTLLSRANVLPIHDAKAVAQARDNRVDTSAEEGKAQGVG